VLHVEAATRDGVRLYLKTRQPVRPGDAVRVAVDVDRALIFATGQSEPSAAAVALADPDEAAT
jgi:hypothetical protein